MKIFDILNRGKNKNDICFFTKQGVLEELSSLTGKIRKESDRKQWANKLNFKTFQKWPVKEDFPDEADAQWYIVSLVCKACCDILAHKKLR